MFATFIAFLGVKLSKKSADSEHPYGHDRLECVASMVLAAILLATGIGIGMSGVKTIIAGDYSHLQAQHSWQMHGITDQMHFLPLVH